jgi:RNA polymerase sigma factor (sigma-70 family)
MRSGNEAVVVSKSETASILSHLFLVAADGDGRPTDRELVAHYSDRRDQGAFALLFQRHGPMVLAVCRRVLGHAQDAEDAFQAVFIVLARKARSLRGTEVLGRWLYGVAHRVALRARRANARRRKHEAATSESLRPIARCDGADHGLRPAVEEELARLPAKYRIPVVLCYFEGKTTKEAARELGLPAGTVSARLARARKRLRRGLVCRAPAFAPRPGQGVERSRTR